jgi:hypothetical protein
MSRTSMTAVIVFVSIFLLNPFLLAITSTDSKTKEHSLPQSEGNEWLDHGGSKWYRTAYMGGAWNRWQ